jgi:hypothetical protein
VDHGPGLVVKQFELLSFVIHGQFDCALGNVGDLDERVHDRVDWNVPYDHKIEPGQ